MAAEHILMPSISHQQRQAPVRSSFSTSSTSIHGKPPVNGNGTNDIQAIDSIDIINLPYRTLTSEARMAEYTTENPSGLQPVVSKSPTNGQPRNYELVTFTPGDPENPKNWSKAYKWWCTMIVALTCFAVAFNSAVITADFAGPARTFGVSQEVALLAITLDSELAR